MNEWNAAFERFDAAVMAHPQFAKLVAAMSSGNWYRKDSLADKIVKDLVLVGVPKENVLWSARESVRLRQVRRPVARVGRS